MLTTETNLVNHTAHLAFMSKHLAIEIQSMLVSLFQGIILVV